MNAAQQYGRGQRPLCLPSLLWKGEGCFFFVAQFQCVVSCEKGHLLDQLIATKLQNIVRFLCCVEKTGKEDTYSSHVKKKTL